MRHVNPIVTEKPEPRAPRLFRHAGRKYLPFKRMLDVVYAALLLALFGPLMILIAIGIKLYSPGPVLFRQQRLGKDGKLFTMLKFRSMKAGADPRTHREHTARLIRDNVVPAEQGQGTLKLQNDPRITGLGRIMRRTSLDELPQLFNVLRGEMSLVGPRPPLPYEVELYQDRHKRRFDALPGITGYWQVAGRNQVSFDRMVQMDIEYIENVNFWWDMQIIFKTPLEMLRGKGGG